ncbi:MAG: SdrD B-like domain-containing protein [Candidatus Krumholzibacteriia bacterium]
MLRRKRFSVSLIVFVFVALTLALMFSCSDQPTAIEKDSGGGLTGSGTFDPGASGSFLLGEVSDSSIAPGTLEIWAMNVAFNETTGLATFDVQLLNRTQRTIAPPIRFVITNIGPPDIAVIDFDGVSRDGFPFYDFSAKLGGNNVFEPGERTDLVTMRFHTVTARSFAIGFRIDIGPPDGTGIIGGVVFFDSNGNGVRDRCGRCNEPGIPGITVALERTLGDGDKVTLLARTDSSGVYRFAGLREGVHKVFVGAPEDVWKVTSANPLLVTLVKGSDGKVQDFIGADFGLFPLRPKTILFGPIVTGLFSPWGTEIDSAFVNPPSLLPVVFKYYLTVDGCRGMPSVLDSAEAWINGEMVFEYVRTGPISTPCLAPQTIEIRDGLVKEGRNTIRLSLDGDEWAALNWVVFKKP